MAIARDTNGYSSATQGSGVGDSLTLSHIIGSGSNRLLVVAVTISWSGSQTSDSVTWNGTALTKRAEIAESGYGGSTHIWTLTNPASGTYNVVANYTTDGGSGGSKKVVAIGYTGVDQTTPIDNTATSTGNSVYPHVYSITTTADNCWAFVTDMHRTDGGEGLPTASTNATVIETGAPQGNGCFDNQGYGDITPAGSFGMTIAATNTLSTTQWVSAEIAMAPAVSTATDNAIAFGMNF